MNHFVLNEGFGDTLDQVYGDFNNVDLTYHAYSTYPQIPVLCEGDEKYSNTGYCQGINFQLN